MSDKTLDLDRPKQARPAPYPSSGASLEESASFSNQPRQDRGAIVPPKGQVPTVEIISLLANVDVRNLGGGRGGGGGCPCRYRRVCRRISGRGSNGRRRGFSDALPCRNVRQASGRPRCHQTPQTESQLPRARHGRGNIPFSKRPGRPTTGRSGLLSTSSNYREPPDS